MSMIYLNKYIKCHSNMQNVTLCRVAEQKMCFCGDFNVSKLKYIFVRDNSCQ